MGNYLKIAFAGKQGSGKTSAANYLEKNYNFKRYLFAKKIRDIAMDLFGATYDEVYVSKSKRGLLQDIGRNMRSIDVDVWTKYLLNEIKDADHNVVIDDLRMKSEFDALKQLGFIIIKVECSREICRSRIGFYGDENDITETELDTLKNWDYVINNEKDFDHLNSQIKSIIEQII